ncbi:MAG TPA: ribonuclease HI family protein [Verrucomicrobiae bacterium]|nr:ribonuclease HI family protein [Verrucomicrobiae bacterium]
MSILTIHTDGGARGNPGPAAVGVVLESGDFHLEHGRHIGDATNNVAEYTGVIDALDRVAELEIPVTELHFFLDSELVVRQILGQYRVKEITLQALHAEVLKKLRATGLPYRFTHVRREQNKLADKLVNQTLDGVLH